MRIVFPDNEIAALKADWEPQLRSYAEETNAILCNARRLPIYDQAIPHAAAWLRKLIDNPPYLEKHHTLIIAGDEHLHAAASEVAIPSSAILLYRSAWKHWWSGVFYGKVPWWCEASWAINCPERIIHLVNPNVHDFQLTANKTYLCSAEIAGRGAHSILSCDEQGALTSKPFSEWLVT